MKWNENCCCGHCHRDHAEVNYTCWLFRLGAVLFCYITMVGLFLKSIIWSVLCTFILISGKISFIVSYWVFVSFTITKALCCGQTYLEHQKWCNHIICHVEIVSSTGLVQGKPLQRKDDLIHTITTSYSAFFAPLNLELPSMVSFYWHVLKLHEQWTKRKLHGALLPWQ